MVVTSLPPIQVYKAKRTTSKEFTKNIPDHLGFWIVIITEEHVMGCFEIGGHKTSRLWEFFFCKSLGLVRLLDNNQLTPNISLNWIVDP